MDLASRLQVNADKRSVIDGKVDRRYLSRLYNALMRGQDFDDSGLEEHYARNVDITLQAGFSDGDIPHPNVWDGVDSYTVFLWVMCVRFFCGAAQDLSDEMTWYAAAHDPNLFGSFFAHAASPLNMHAVKPREIVILRPNIEHNMLGVIMGRGGLDDLGGTLWGQTQLECYSDSMHGLWGMSYKYNERAIVWNEKNLVRLWDVCYGGYNGWKDSTLVTWSDEGADVWRQATHATNEPYQGPSMAVMSFDVVEGDTEWKRNWPSPITFHQEKGRLPVDAEQLGFFDADQVFCLNGVTYRQRYHQYRAMMPDFTDLHMCTKTAGECVQENTASVHSALAFQGSMRVLTAAGNVISEVHGCGHHGPDYVGVASRRNGKGMTTTGRPPLPVFAAV
eukprot:3640991-Rhodomonas_salina.1